MTEENTITPDQLLGLAKQMQRAEEDTTPFAVVNGKDVSVVGDVNKTEVKKNDYQIKFRFPFSLFETVPKGAQKVGQYYVVTTEYKDVSVTPRKDLIILDSIMKVFPFFKKLKENGEVEDYSKEELFSIFAYAGNEVHLALYNLVATFLEIDDELGQYMLPGSVITVMGQIIENHPEMFNEADVFFG